MPTVGPLYATTASGWPGASVATGPPDGNDTASNASPLVVGGFGAQTAIGSQPTSIDAVRVTVRARGSGSATFTSGNYSAPLSLSMSMGNHTFTLPARTWANLANLGVTITANNAYVDAVWVEVDYTVSVGHPMSGAAPVVSTVSGGGLSADRALSGSVPAVSLVAGSLDVLPGGLSGVVESTSTITGTIGLLAGLSGVSPVTSGVAGAARLLAGLSGVVVAHSEVTGTIGRVEIHVVRAPARTVRELLSGSHRREDHVIILTGERAGERLPLLGGDLTLDEAADVHATGTLQLPPEPWLRALLDPLTARTELAVVLAVRGDDGELHSWQRAVVHATDMPVGVSSQDGLALSVSVADRSDWVRKAGMRAPYAGLGSESILTHALRLVTDRAPWLPIGGVTDPGYRSGADLHVGGLGEDPWKLAVQLAWSVGQRLYVDAAGRIATRGMLTAPEVAASWAAGEDGCLVSSIETQRSDADVANVLGVPWEEAEPEDAGEDWVPRSGVAWWEDRTSPLGIEGPLGERVRAYSGDTSIIQSEAHAIEVAVSHGTAQQGALSPLDFVVATDPLLDVGDSVRVVRPEVGVSEICRIQVLKYGLGSALMSGSMAERRVLG